MRPAIAAMRMQFCSGPETHVFEACEEHVEALRKGDVSCFLLIKGEQIQVLDPDDEFTCWFCREGGDL